MRKNIPRKCQQQFIKTVKEDLEEISSHRIAQALELQKAARMRLILRKRKLGLISFEL